MRQLVIKQQRYPPIDGPVSYGVFMETDEVFEGLEYWQDDVDAPVFVCYGWTERMAEWAVRELSKR